MKFNRIFNLNNQFKMKELLMMKMKIYYSKNINRFGNKNQIKNS